MPHPFTESILAWPLLVFYIKTVDITIADRFAIPAVRRAES